MSRSAGACAVTSIVEPLVASITPPASGRSSPAMTRSSVVLPAPVGPSTTMNSPSPALKLTSSSAVMRPNRLVRLRTSYAGMRHLRALPRQRGARVGVEPPVSGRVEADADRLAFAEAPARCDARLDQRLAEANLDEVVRAEKLGVLRDRVDTAYVDAHKLRPD